jgi:hypothetical protein
MSIARGRQRWLVFGVLLVVLLAVLITPKDEHDAARAVQACGPSNANRASLDTGNGVHLTPCLSKVNLHMSIPRTQTSNIGCGVLFLQPCYADGKWKITGVKKAGSQTLKYADGTTESGLWRLTFRQFEIYKDATLATTNGSGYTMRIVPDANAQLGKDAGGGGTIYTDLWVTGSSRIYLNFLTFSCPNGVQVDDVLWSIANIFTSISDTGCGMDLDIRYAVTTSTAADGSITGIYSVNLPNTTITVS